MSTHPRAGARGKKKRAEAKSPEARKRGGDVVANEIDPEAAAEAPRAGRSRSRHDAEEGASERDAAIEEGDGGETTVHAGDSESEDALEGTDEGESLDELDRELTQDDGAAIDAGGLGDSAPDELLEAADEDEPAIPGSDTAAGPGLEKTRPTSVSEAHLKSVLESLVFVSDKPVAARRLARFARAKTKEVERLLGELIQEYAGRGIELVEVAGGYQFRSTAANAPFVREIVQSKPVRLSRAQLETLAISAYRQPLTRPELEEIRGVDSGSALKVLLERGLVKILGRKDEPGRPLLYGTTPQFLEFFGMNSLDQLPTLKEFSELSDESRALFARKTGEEIESIGDISLPETHWEDEGEDLSEAEASGEGQRAGVEDDAADASVSAEHAGDDAANADDDDADDDDADDDDADDDDADDDDADDDDADDDDADDDDADDDDEDDDDADDDDE